jgi:hypothetical protein
VWDGDGEYAGSGRSSAVGSKPTVWDGDVCMRLFTSSNVNGSKPTVWDGDAVELCPTAEVNPPWRRFLTCSKPTAWDGDKSLRVC